MKKALVIITLLTLTVLLCKGWLFRLVITYTSIGERPAIHITDTTLQQEIDQADPVTDLKSLVAEAEDITTRILNFTFDSAPRNPNQLVHSEAANCIGYSAMFNSVVNQLIRQHQLKDRFSARHRIGRIRCFGINLHQFFKSSFFKDHDYNEVKDMTNGEVIAIDPTISDYLRISRVTTRDR